jgi:hypothetical protein
MKSAATHFALSWALEDVASWENEGGAISSAGAAPKAPAVTVGWPRASIVDPAPAVLRGADNGLADSNSLTILRVSLLLLVPALASIAVFWALR